MDTDEEPSDVSLSSETETCCIEAGALCIVVGLKSTRTANGGEYALFSSLNISAVEERPVIIIDYLPPPVCNYTLNFYEASYPKEGGTGNVNVTVTDSRCTWTAVSNASWITVTGGYSGTGNGTVTYTVAENTETVRKGTINIAGQTFTVKQQPEIISLPWLPILLE